LEDGIPVKLGLTALAVAAVLGFNLSPVALCQQQQPAPVPDAPAPQAPKPLTDVNGPITPGLGAGKETAETPDDSPSQATPPSNLAPTAQDKIETQTTPPEIFSGPDAAEKIGTIIHLNTTYVEVPVTVKDNKGHLVAGLTWRDFKVYENNSFEPVKLFYADPYPLSIAFVIDQSVTSDVMAKVNNSLDAIQGALTPYDEMAVFTYGNGAEDRSHGFTGAQSARVPFLLSMVKTSGAEIEQAVPTGPLGGCPIYKNGDCVDPNLQVGRSAGSTANPIIPKEVHTLNDAILAAAKQLASRPKGRRRIIYVISDGHEYGSKASEKEVVRFLQTNEIGVYGTLVGSSATWGEGYISKIHLPFTMYDNILYKYIAATGGQADSERNLNGIEKSYMEIAKEARNQYTLVYASHENTMDSRYRKIDVRVERPGLDVTSKLGYYPSAQMAAP
jgi:VWFA-related protein